jgi:hypothetical protein
VEVKDLQNHIRALASLEESDSPMISCYLLSAQPRLASWHVRFRIT